MPQEKGYHGKHSSLLGEYLTAREVSITVSVIVGFLMFPIAIYVGAVGWAVGQGLFELAWIIGFGGLGLLLYSLIASLLWRRKRR